jgi:hypothetical protein
MRIKEYRKLYRMILPKLERGQKWVKINIDPPWSVEE